MSRSAIRLGVPKCLLRNVTAISRNKVGVFLGDFTFFKKTKASDFGEKISLIFINCRKTFLEQKLSASKSYSLYGV